jgi:hypothetical protein
MFFKFLSFYALTSTNNASFDEYILDLSKKLNVKEIKIDNGIYDLILDELFNDKNIIISGTAGDGKTFLLRRLFFEWIGGSREEFKEFIPSVEGNSKKFFFIKDFTELSEKDKSDILNRLEKSIFNASNERFIIAANDGILVDTLKKEKKFELLNIVENLIDGEKHEKLALFDLFQVSAYKNFELLLDEILKRAKKVECDYENCVIHSNIKLIEKFKSQILKLIRISDLNYEHLTFRKLFMIIANMILGYEEGVFSSCEEANNYYKDKERIKSAFYNNIFLDNLEKSAKEKISSFLELNVGKETTNYIDEKILYENIEIENYFFNKDKFKKIKEKYFDDNSNYEELNEYLIYLRRYLFFSNKELAKDLIVYKHLDEFIKIVESEKVNIKVRQKLITALNRIFLGELVDYSDKLYIASSFTNTFSKISDEIIEEIPFENVKFNVVSSIIDKNFKKVYLIVKDKKLIIDLHMYEFLRRVSEGIVPLSFSPEYYEKVLNFKAKLIDKELEFFRLFEVNNFEIITKSLYLED